ncbi:hypothetical protein ABPG72_011285 [Tetrahymena utriculariae]
MSFHEAKANDEESKAKLNNQKIDFEKYIIEKYNSLKNRSGQNLQINQHFSSPNQAQSQPGTFSRLTNNLNVSKQSSFTNDQIGNQSLLKNTKQTSNKVNFSLYYNDLQEQLSKYGIKVSRYSDKLNKILEDPNKIKENEYFMFDKSSQQSTLQSSKATSNQLNYLQSPKISKQNSEFSADYKELEQKTERKQENLAESNLKSHLFKKHLKEMQAKCLQNENFYDRVKDFPINEEDYIKLKNSGKITIFQDNNCNDMHNAPLNINPQSQRSNSLDYGINNINSSKQSLSLNGLVKFTRLSIQKQQSQESDRYNSFSHLAIEETNKFLSSFDEIKQKHTNRNQNQTPRDSDRLNDSVLKHLQLHQRQQSDVESQKTQLLFCSSQQIPFQRQWAISSPLTRQSPFKPKRLPDILDKQANAFDSPKLDIRNQKQRQNFLRNRFFDIHFDSFDHKLLKLKEGNKKEISNFLNLNQQEDQNETNKNEESQDQSHFRIKRKPSIYHQKSVSVFNSSTISQKEGVEKQTNTPLNQRAKAPKNNSEAPKQRFVKPYPVFVRKKINDNVKKQSQMSNWQTLGDQEQLDENIYQLNEKLIEGLEYNIDRFMEKLKSKILSNTKLFDEIRQDCYIFDFEQFLINLKNFIFSSISKISQSSNQQVNKIRKTSMLFDGVGKALKFNLFKSQKCNVQEIINIILSSLQTFKYLKQEKPVQNNKINFQRNKLKLQDSSENQSVQSSEKALEESEKRDKQDQEVLSRQNSVSSFQCTSPKGLSQKRFQMNPQLYMQKQDYSPKSLQLSRQQTQNIKSERNINKATEKSQYNYESPQNIRQQNNEQYCFQNYQSQYEEQIGKQQIQNKKLLEQRKKEEDILYNYMQVGYNDIQNYSKTNLKLTQSVFDQLIEIIMEILIEFQYSNLSINQYIGSLYSKAASILGVSVKSEIPPSLYEKVIQATISKMELQQKQSANLTKFLYAVFEVEEEIIYKRNVLDNSGNDKRSQQLLTAIKDIALQCQINYLQFYSLKLFLYETMKDIQANFQTIEKAIFYIEAFRNTLCTTQHSFLVQRQQFSHTQQEQQNEELNYDNKEYKKHEEYVIDFSSKSSMRKLIDEFLWQLQHEMIEFMQSDSKLHNEMELFIGDLIFSLAGIYPQNQILMHKNLTVLQKSFYDQVIYNLCKLLFQKKIPIEEIRNIFISSQQISAQLNFEPKLILKLGGFISILQLSFIFSSVYFMDNYKAKCSVSNNVSLIQQQTNSSQSQQNQEEENTQIIISIIKDYQLIWFEFLIASYFSSYPTYNSYDVKAAFTINKIDHQIIKRWIQFLSKLGVYFDQYSIDKFIQELSISISYIK